MYTRRSVPVDRRREKRLRRADLRQRFHVYAEVRPCRPSPGRAPPAGPTFSPATPCVWLQRLDLESFSKSETTLARATVPADAHPCDRLVAGFPTHPSAEPCDRRFRFGSRARACLDLEKFSKSETASQTTLTRRSVPVDRRREERLRRGRPFRRRLPVSGSSVSTWKIFPSPKRPAKPPLQGRPSLQTLTPAIASPRAFRRTHRPSPATDGSGLARARACLDLEKFSKSETASQTTLTRRSVPVDRRRDRIGCRRPYGRGETAVAIASPRAIRRRPRPSRATDGFDFQV